MISILKCLWVCFGGLHDAKRQEGATLIEYALIISAIALVVLLGSLAITEDLTGFFDTAGNQLDGTGGGGDG